MFEIKPISPEAYRAQTRRSTWTVMAIFLVLAMLSASACTALFGTDGGDNFWWNLLGVAFGLGLTAALVRLQLWQRPFMDAARYGWQLKRSLMSVTNVMHQVKAAVAQGNAEAMKLLRFYHLGLMQMYQLEGNSAEASALVHELDAHRLAMEQAGLDVEQSRLNPAWLEAVKAIKA